MNNCSPDGVIFYVDNGVEAVVHSGRVCTTHLTSDSAQGGKSPGTFPHTNRDTPGGIPEY